MAPAAELAAPADAEALWREYRPLCRSIVRKSGIPAQDIDDVTSAIMLRLIERDIIAMFDPDHHIEHGGQVIAAKFRSFFTHHVQLYVKGQRDKIGRLLGHETIICDQPASEDGTSWIDLFGGEWWDDYSELDAAEFVSRMRTWLAFVPPRSDADRCDLVALFDELVREARADGKVSYSEVQERFGIGYTTARGWVTRLRLLLAEGMDAFVSSQAVEVGGIELSPEEIREAIRILRGCLSTAVRQPLARAGHRLASPPDLRWYHAFAKAELAMFPELRTPHGTKQKHFGHVKTAVLHRLERLLAEVASGAAGPSMVSEETSGRAVYGLHETVGPAVAEPEEPLTFRDEIEAELWKLTASPTAEHISAAVEKIIALAQEAACPA